MNKCNYCVDYTSGDNLICESCREEDDDDFDDRDLEEVIREAWEEEKAERASLCKCGAWIFGKDGIGKRVADCICGAE